MSRQIKLTMSSVTITFPRVFRTFLIRIVYLLNILLRYDKTKI